MRTDAGIALTPSEIGVSATTVKVASASNNVISTISNTSDQAVLTLFAGNGLGTYQLNIIGNATGTTQKSIRLKQGTIFSANNTFNSGYWKIQYDFIAAGSILKLINLYTNQFQTSGTVTDFDQFTPFQVILSKSTAADTLNIQSYRWTHYPLT
jgi:hypothetical protein